MNQGRGLKRLAWLLLCQSLRRQLPQLLIDEREELFCCLLIALVDGLEDLGDIGHDRRIWSRRRFRNQKYVHEDRWVNWKMPRAQ